MCRMKGGRSKGVKKKTGWSVLSVLCFLLALAFFVLAAWEYAPYVKSDIDMRQLRKMVLEEEADGGEEEKQEEPVDWEKLKKINPDIVAWIKVPGTKIDYPVLKCGEWNEYLHKDYRGKESYPGSVFLQPDSQADLSARHTILYGHNMKNQSMFGSLHRFEKESFGKEHRKVFLYQPGKKVVAEIYSVYTCKDKSSTYETIFPSGKEWEDWVGRTMEARDYDTGTVPGQEEKVVTLSTCSGGRRRDLRYVVHAVIKEEITDVQ